MSTPKPQKKYNQSDKGRKVRAKWNKEHRQQLEQKRENRTGECSVCGKVKWLIRKHPPTCRKCNCQLFQLIHYKTQMSL